ncbi:hypothetical protein TNCV_4798781 [Trichonephila clavipes]|nr:hypothetical protein TNCV_4798781 [Trichonephila clavipes]
MTPEMMKTIHKEEMDDCQLKVFEHADILGISKRAVHRILSENVDMRKLWIGYFGDHPPSHLDNRQAEKENVCVRMKGSRDHFWQYVGRHGPIGIQLQKTIERIGQLRDLEPY